jgi:hypothetical protein
MIRFISDPRLMPCIMIAFSIIAAVIYGCQRDYRRCAYWSAAAILNITVTF